MVSTRRPPLYPGYPYPSLGMEQLAAWHRNPYSIPLSSAPGSPMARFAKSPKKFHYVVDSSHHDKHNSSHF